MFSGEVPGIIPRRWSTVGPNKRTEEIRYEWNTLIPPVAPRPLLAAHFRRRIGRLFQGNLRKTSAQPEHQCLYGRNVHRPNP